MKKVYINILFKYRYDFEVKEISFSFLNDISKNSYGAFLHLIQQFWMHSAGQMKFLNYFWNTLHASFRDCFCVNYFGFPLHRNFSKLCNITTMKQKCFLLISVLFQKLTLVFLFHGTLLSSFTNFSFKEISLFNDYWINVFLS